MSSVLNPPELADAGARLEALDTAGSFIVQAPAGAGKTELLTQRFLALLGRVDEPEEILAVTFTRAATAEMRLRVLNALQNALAVKACDNDEITKHALAVLEQSEKRGWNLLQQPERLNITTLDALALRIAHAAPLFSRLGGKLVPTENPEPLYDRAARRTLQRIGGQDHELSQAIEVLLSLRETRLSDCERLLANMLKKRDQWMSLLLPLQLRAESDWDEVRALLEEPMQRERKRAVREARDLLHRHPGVAEQMLLFVAHACRFDSKKDLSRLLGLREIDQLESVEHWECVCDFLLTKDPKGAFRKQFDKRDGFPTVNEGGNKNINDAAKEWLNALPEVPGLLQTLCAIRHLPPPRYADEDWPKVRHILNLLVRSVAELRVVFAEEGVLDFAELSQAAVQALSEPEAAQNWSERIRHILIDEFQDTSRPQYALLQRLVSEWQAGDGRTCFLVGDPMQSIYLFREAQVELFHHAALGGIEQEDHRRFPLTPLTLSTNFRSTGGIVHPLNEMFADVFRSGPISFVPSHPANYADAPPALEIHPDFTDANSPLPESEQLQVCRKREAERVLDIIRSLEPRMQAAAKQGRAYTVAVLVRARAHLALIAQALRASSVSFRAVEIETLRERQEVLDIFSLLRALTHPMDRIAWLSILRAPWCGLGLLDLHALCGDGSREEVAKPLLTLLRERLDRLSPDGRSRAVRVVSAMETALDSRSRGLFSSSPAGLALWLEQTWDALGGPACYDESAVENVRLFLRMVGTLPPDGLAARDGNLDRRLDQLFAQPDPATSEHHGVQLMTIHKAKGLGFDVVIVPGLDRTPKTEAAPLVTWIARTDEETGAPELLLAPIGGSGEETGSLFRWVQRQRTRQLLDEQQRLLYVACSRARSELHLLGTGKTSAGTAGQMASVVRTPANTSLLGTGWPFLERKFTRSLNTRELTPAHGSNGQAGFTHGARILPFAVPATATAGVVADLAAARDPDRHEPAAGDHRSEAEVHSGPQPQILHRLAANWQWIPQGTDPVWSEPEAGIHGDPFDPGEPTFPRRDGTREARARGVVLHALLEEASQSLCRDPNVRIDSPGGRWSVIGRALLRQYGLPPAAEAAILREVMEALRATLSDPRGRWLLSARSEARSEAAWASQVEGRLKTLRPDRTFVAGAEPGTGGNQYLWIIDYKTASPAGDRTAFLAEERKRHLPQLARYSALLRSVYEGRYSHRCGLYYPMMAELDWWSD